MLATFRMGVASESPCGSVSKSTARWAIRILSSLCRNCALRSRCAKSLPLPYLYMSAKRSGVGRWQAKEESSSRLIVLPMSANVSGSSSDVLTEKGFVVGGVSGVAVSGVGVSGVAGGVGGVARLLKMRSSLCFVIFRKSFKDRFRAGICCLREVVLVVVVEREFCCFAVLDVTVVGDDIQRQRQAFEGTEERCRTRFRILGTLILPV
jgi:hypothetical protein